jgi:hypothetical protein
VLTRTHSPTSARATYLDGSGVWQEAAAGVARKASNGLLIEGARTKGVRNPRFEGGAAATIPTHMGGLTVSNGITPTILGIGTEHGLNFIEVQLNGTASANSFVNIQPDTGLITAATNGQAVTSSAWPKHVSGTYSTTGGGAGTGHKLTLLDATGTQMENLFADISATSAVGIMQRLA